ncbi:MAG: hypothetical protein ACI9JN_002458 [Bacteroidia bacterium]|jgi:hypothetical protein
MSKSNLLALGCAGVMLFIVRILVHVHFNSVFVDGDQTITWLSAVDKANGLWYTPYFYGQFYNISMEAILSAPFIALGGKVQHVVPIVSNIIGVLPYFIGAFYLVRKQAVVPAIGLICLGIILPAQYHFVTAMARGFSGGLAVFSFGFLLTGSKHSVIRIIGFTCLFSSYLVNPNVLIIMVPLALLWFYNLILIKQLRGIKTILPIVLGLVGTICVYFWIQQFNNPMYSVHNLWKLHVSWDYFAKSIKSLDARFLYLFPFLPKIGSLVLGTLVLILGYLIFKKNRTGVVVVGLTILFILSTLALNKTMDGTDSTFFPYSRMYLALPFVLSLGYYLLLKEVKNKKRHVVVLVVIGLVGLVYQFSDVPKKAIVSVRKNSGVVQVLRINKLCVECEKLKSLQQKFNADVMVFHSKTDEYLYGCKALEPSISTLYPKYDRRYWTFAKHADTVYNTVLFLDWSLQLDEKMIEYTGTFKHLKNLPYPAYLLSNNTESIIDLYRNNNFALRPYTE